MKHSLFRICLAMATVAVMYPATTQVALAESMDEVAASVAANRFYASPQYVNDPAGYVQYLQRHFGMDLHMVHGASLGIMNPDDDYIPECPDSMNNTLDGYAADLAAKVGQPGIYFVLSDYGVYTTDESLQASVRQMAADSSGLCSMTGERSPFEYEFSKALFAARETVSDCNFGLTAPYAMKPYWADTAKPLQNRSIDLGSFSDGYSPEILVPTDCQHHRATLEVKQGSTWKNVDSAEFRGGGGFLQPCKSANCSGSATMRLVVDGGPPAQFVVNYRTALSLTAKAPAEVKPYGSFTVTINVRTSRAATCSVAIYWLRPSGTSWDYTTRKFNVPAGNKTVRIPLRTFDIGSVKTESDCKTSKQKAFASTKTRVTVGAP
mgnify:CR=1 FL=1